MRSLPSSIYHFNTHGAPDTTAIGVLGMPGFTAYNGMKVIGQPKPVKQWSSQPRRGRSAAWSVSLPDVPVQELSA